ncbi:MAG: hypothetical protein K6G18_06395 [Treponema sp.]|nr:hypothetical protein [Treponema sp.]
MTHTKKLETLAAAVILPLLIFSIEGCASTKREEDAWESKLDEAQKKIEKIETEEQDFDIPEWQDDWGSKKKKKNERVRNSDGSPVVVTSLPMIDFSGRGVKVEFEDMLLTDTFPFADYEASAGWATRLSSRGSKAEFSITLPAGRYECLLSEKASDAAHATVSVSIGESSFDTYPSDPPLGIWELTTRMPIYFDVAEETPYHISISSASAGMSLDYIQFVKIQ